MPASLVQTLTPLVAGGQQRRGGRDGTPGRCSNLDYCSIGMQRVLVDVPVGQPFICPECGGKLRPPAESTVGRPWVMPVLRILVLLVGVGLGGVQGYLIGRVQPVARGAVSDASRDAAIRLNTARTALGLTALPAEAAVKAAQESPPPVPVAPMPPVVRQIEVRAYPKRAAPLDVADPPQHLPGEQHAGQVTVDCMLAAGSVAPRCLVGDVRGSDAFSAAAMNWLKTLEVQYVPAETGAAAEHRWRIIFEDFNGGAPVAAPAPVKVRARKR